MGLLSSEERVAEDRPGAQRPRRVSLNIYLLLTCVDRRIDHGRVQYVGTVGTAFGGAAKP